MILFGEIGEKTSVHRATRFVIIYGAYGSSQRPRCHGT
jgi:hypothetical protein